MKALACLVLLAVASTLACIPPGDTRSRINTTAHPEYASPLAPPAMGDRIGLKFTGTDPRKYLFAGGEQLLVYVDSLPRCPYEAIRTLETTGNSQRTAIEKLQLELRSSGGDALIRFVAKDSTWVFFQPSTMTQPQVKKQMSIYVCRGTSIRFMNSDCAE
jgi:hypothetical protein